MFQKIKDYFSSIDNYVQKGVSHDFAFINHSSFDGDSGYMSEVQKNPVANRCIDLLSRSVGSIPISVIDGENSTVADLIRKSLQVPNYDEDISIFLQKIVIGMMIDGSVYVLSL